MWLLFYKDLKKMKLRNFSYSKVLRNKEIHPENYIPCLAIPLLK